MNRFDDSSHFFSDSTRVLFQFAKNDSSYFCSKDSTRVNSSFLVNIPKRLDSSHPRSDAFRPPCPDIILHTIPNAFIESTDCGWDLLQNGQFKNLERRFGATPLLVYDKATIRLVHWVVSLRTNQFALVSRIDTGYKKE